MVQNGILPGLTRAQIKVKKAVSVKDTDKDKRLVSGHQWAKLLTRVFEVGVSKCKYLLVRYSHSVL